MSRTLRSSWIDSFVDYMANADTPEQFVFWSGIGVLSAIMKRNAFYKRKMQTVYPNHYIVLCGGPGTGKGSAMTPALELMKRSGCCNLLFDRMSAEKMVEIIANGFGSKVITGGNSIKLGTHDTSVCIYEDELSALFGISDWMIDFFNRVWTDGYFKYSTKAGNEIEVVNNATTILGGCVPEFLKNISRTKSTVTISSGFTSRSIFSFSSKPMQIKDYWGDDTATLNKAVISEDDLIEDMRYIATNCIGEYKFDQAARKLMSQFDFDMKTSTDSSGRPLYDSEVVTFFKNRIGTHCGKLSMLLCASEKDDRVIESHHVDIAIKALTKVKEDLDIAFRFIGESKDVEAQAKVLDFIEKRGHTNRAEILRYLKNHVTGDQLDRILLVLNEVGITRYATTVGSSQRGIIHNVNMKP